MWSSETLATLMSMISISVGSITVTATIHLLPRIASTALSNRLSPFIGLPDVHRGHDGHPDPQHVLRVFPPVEHDLHRDPLHDLDVVPRGVLGGEEGKGGPRPRHDAFHLPVELLPRERVNADGDRMAGTDLLDLGLLVVRHHPHARRRGRRPPRIAGRASPPRGRTPAGGRRRFAVPPPPRAAIAPPAAGPGWHSSGRSAPPGWGWPPRRAEVPPSRGRGGPCPHPARSGPFRTAPC